jgi:hypothetical protein
MIQQQVEPKEPKESVWGVCAVFRSNSGVLTLKIETGKKFPECHFGPFFD